MNYCRGKFFHLAPHESQAWMGVSIFLSLPPTTFSTIPPTFPGNSGGKVRCARFVAFEVLSWNRFLRELSKETLSRTLDRGGCRFFESLLERNFVFFLFFNGKNFVRYRWKKKRQRKGIKKGIFLLKNRRITWWRILEKEGWVVKDGATLSGPFFAQVNGSARCWPGRGEKYINYPWGVRGTPLGENLRAN